MQRTTTAFIKLGLDVVTSVFYRYQSIVISLTIY